MKDKDYKPGQRIRFMDDSATVSDGQTTKAEGVVNGPIMRYNDGTPLAIPVWCERDNGREATTVMVDPKNVLAV